MERRYFIKQLGQRCTGLVFGFFTVSFITDQFFTKAFAAKPAKGETTSNIPVPAGQVAVPESDAVAQALGYKEDATAIKDPKRKKNDFCNGCTLYTSVNDGWGKCQMITAGLVKAKGWCRSYSKKS